MPAGAAGSQHDAGDDDSLFGSPPPSPNRHTGLSPLALPSGSSSEQNVGTLALPGSHMFNELPSAPWPVTNGSSAIASVQQLGQPQVSPNPPQVASEGSPSVVQPGRSRSSTPVTVRPTRAQKKTGKKSSNRSMTASSTSTPRPTPPPIPLPDSSEPPPSNFLRNQQALLGLAGLVGGINPAKIALPRGSSANNPILVDDEDDTPTIGIHPPYYPMAPAPAAYPAPSSDDIIQTLIKQKNIFPVVGALLSLVSRTSEGQSIWSQYNSQPSGFHRPYVNGSTQNNPPSKRRKVNDVPAGAVDWDVPYPFPTGEGPANYRSNWERQRSKQLIEDLIGLVKSAARKAAAKTYYKMHHQQPLPAVMETEPGKVFRHYRPETLRYGLPPGQTPAYPALSPSAAPPPPPCIRPTASDSPSPATAPPTSTVPTGSKDALAASSTPSIDDLLAVMMAGPETHNQTSSTESQHVHGFPAFSSSSSSSSTAFSTQQLASSSSSFASSSTSQASFNEIAPELQTNINDFLAMIESLPQNELSGLFASSEDPLSMSASPQEHEPAGDSVVSKPQLSSYTDPPPIDFSDPFLASIDPALLGLSTAPDPVNATTNVSMGHRNSISTGTPSTPTMVASPLSLDHDEHGPPTPTWDCAFPEPDVVGGGMEGDVSGTLATVTGGEVEHRGAGIRPDEVGLPEEDGVFRIDKGKGKQRGSGGLELPTVIEASIHHDVVMHDAVSVSSGGQSSGGADPPPISSSFASQPQQTTQGYGAVHQPFQTSSTPAPGGSQPAVPTLTQYPSLPVASTSTPRSHLPSPFQTQSSAPSLPFPLSLAIPILQATQAVASTSSAPLQSQSKKSKQETLMKARAMREQLVAEIKRAKVELWETAMEGGCLVVLGKEVAKGKEAG
ncbi:hypothetical protein BXZ70DRAFT_196999 [Cristinia sonorae]|uniref:Uncharacterized protein n=1 Tax=Cristinia sonorae TaxID=1940300 RepID=A0A8K0XPI6_9AGAR|nr:hypothetical protein BXZ70DRAFT_196999 [Cristinia sonorae]